MKIKKLSWENITHTLQTQSKVSVLKQILVVLRSQLYLKIKFEKYIMTQTKQNKQKNHIKSQIITCDEKLIWQILPQQTSSMQNSC